MKSTKIQCLADRIQQKIDEIAAVAEDLPGVVIIHNIQKQLSPEYISPRGQRELGLTVEELKRLGPEYNYKYFNPEDAQDYVPKIMALLTKNDKDEVISFFQQVRRSENHAWSWYHSSLKILMQDDEGSPLLSITMAKPIDPETHVNYKVSRLLEENDFLRENIHKFKEISEREREILRGMAFGKSASESAQELSISVATVETHRRNIKKKLQTTSFFELTQYARAFDLI